jgi:hypothetical protein
MKLFRPKLKKTIFSIIATGVALVGLCIIFISPITKYLIEKYDVTYTGRQITIDWAYANPFTGYVYLRNLRINELNKDTVFFSAKGASATFAMHKILFNTCEITELHLDQPVGIVIQNKKHLNLDDIVQRFSSKKSSSNKSGSNKSPVHFSILRITTTNGEFHYRDKLIPIDYFIKSTNLESTGVRWNTDTIATTISFVAGKGTGNAVGNFTINTRTLDYHFAADIDNLDLELIRQYLWELINYGMFRARLDLKINATGNFHHTDSITLKGRVAIHDFHLGKTTTENYTSFKKLVLVIDDLSPKNNKYLFDSVTLDDPFVSYERFDSLDNVQAMFGKKGSNISDVTQQPDRFNLVIQLSRYVKKLSKKFFESQYSINSMAINNADIKFSDYSLNEKFSIQANALFFKADSVKKTNKRVKFYLQSGILPYGNLSARLSINPLDTGDLDLNYRIEKVPVTVFNPYIITYTSFPLDKGTLALNGSWKVRQGILESDNNILIIDPRIAVRVKNNDTKWMPLRLIMSLVRERGGIINYKIPITGNLKNPKFHLRDVVADLFENIFIKPPTLPYGLEVKKAEREIEKSLGLTWQMHQSALKPRQKKFMNKMIRFLKENKEASIDIYPTQYTLKEKEYILYYETKKKYFLTTQNKNSRDFSEEDSIEVDKMSVKDISSVLAKNLRKITRDTTMFTIQDKCLHFLGDNRVDTKYLQLVKAREHSFHSLFIKEGIDSQVKIHESQSSVPYDGFSIVRIKYNGAIPHSLQQSYDAMDKLNNKAFRKKYFK